MRSVLAREGVEQGFLPSSGGTRQLKGHSAIAGGAAAAMRSSIQISGRVENQIAVGIRSIFSASEGMKRRLAPASAGNRRKPENCSIPRSAHTAIAGGAVEVA